MSNSKYADGAAHAEAAARRVRALIDSGRLMEALPEIKELEGVAGVLMAETIRALRALPPARGEGEEGPTRPSWAAIGEALGVPGASVYAQYSENSGKLRDAQVRYMKARRKPVEPVRLWGWSLSQAAKVAGTSTASLFRWAGGSQEDRAAGAKPKPGIEVRDVEVPVKGAVPDGSPDWVQPTRTTTRYLVTGDMVKHPELIPGDDADE